MDLKGSLTDTNLKIFPSKNLLNFLKAEILTGSLPAKLGKIVQDGYKPKSKDLETKPCNVNLSEKEIEFLNSIKSVTEDDKETTEDKENSEPNIGKESKIVDTQNKSNESEDNIKPEGPYLTTSDMELLYEYLREKRKEDSSVPYLHELLEGSQIEVPPNQTIKRNPELEARCVKLRAQQEAREYRKMTKGVDNVRMRFPEDSISYQLKQMNRQLIAIGQFIISIFAGFLFGFRGVEWMVGNLDFGFRLLLGVMCALVIALAEIYFLAKKLNEELSVPETTQLGGPPKFVDEKLYQNVVKKTVDKPHQD